MIEHIFISAAHGAPLTAQHSVQVDAGKGIAGDRNYGKQDEPGQNITLVEAEELEAFCQLYGRAYEPSVIRRNLVTRGVRLNDLVGKQFQLGELVLRGVELCEPCSIVGDLLAGPAISAPQVVKYWVGRGGLRADVVQGGQLHIGAVLTL
ncbi:MOSC domain-containing protein [Massilia sp. W12]|uniref:MOSC domain-containing protein n=1 Tax=Massilia sp. W12 TaxID=3126507 RepID=UPI0030D4AC45